ncbi:MAG: M1 family metallopeptidase [Deltaproteobacteria bacterium]|nr:M1 family metallopeptidase [Deltaproteobacteria bacterium]
MRRQIIVWLSTLALPVALGTLHAAADRSQADPFATWRWPSEAHHDPQRPAPPLRLPKTKPPLDYRIDARLDPSRHRISGDLTLTFKNRSRVPLRDLRLHLYLNAFANNHTRFAKTSGGVHRGHRRTTRGWIRVAGARVNGALATSKRVGDGTVIAIAPRKALPPGTRVTLHLHFEAKLPRIYARTGYAGDFLMIAQWYPKLGVLRPDGTWDCPEFHANAEFFADFARYRLRLTLPKRFIVGHTGSRRGRRVIGDLQTIDVNALWVHDLALAAWPHFVRRNLNVGGVRVHLLGVPGRDQSAREIALLRAGLLRLGRWFGAYPYPELTVVDVPAQARGADAMEYPQLFTIWFPLGAPRAIHAVDEILLHELTHQYFQGMVATNEAKEPWLDEGVTTFVSGLLLDARFGPRRSFLDLGPLIVGQGDKNQLHHAAAGDDALGVARPAATFATWRRYGGTVYGRTAAMLYTLDSLMGRRPMLLALRAYVQRHAFSHPRRPDLVAALRHATPAPKRHVVDDILGATLDGKKGLSVDLRCERDALILTHHGLSLPLWIRWRRQGDPTPHFIRVGATHAGAHDSTRPPTRDAPTVRRLPAPGLVDAALGPPGRLLLTGAPLLRRCSRRHGAWGAASRLAPLIETFLAGVSP